MHFLFDIFKCCYAWEVLMAHPLVVTQTSQLHPDFIRAIVGLMHSTFIWQLNLWGSFVSKLLYKGKVSFEGPWSYRGIFELGMIPKGKAGGRREALFGVQKATETPERYSTWRWSHLAGEQWCLTRLLQETFQKVRFVFVCVSQTNNKDTTTASCRRGEGTMSALVQKAGRNLEFMG